MIRLDAVQRWPVEKKALCAHSSTATPRSASSSTTCGFLPPISSCTLAPRATQAAATCLPTACDPVKLTASTPGWSMIAWPTSRPLPITRLKAPGGSPAREMISASAHALPGTMSAGLITTQFPAARAGASFHVAMSSGKFQGMICPTTPSGSWKW